MARALIVTQYFHPEPCAAAHRMEALARALRDSGMDVTVIAPMPSFPSGQIDAAYRGKRLTREDFHGIEVVRLRHVATARRYSRYLAWLSFAGLASIYGVFRAARADVVIMSSPPITLAIPAMAVRLLRGSRLVVDVRDVFPDLPIQMGVWKERGLMARVIGALARRLYALASLVVAVTPTALAQVRRRAGNAPVVLSPNGCDRVRPRSGTIKRRNGEFVATFTGNMGVANGMDLLLDTAKLVQDEEIRIALIGGGADYEHVAGRIQAERIPNVDYYGVVPRDAAVGALAESDAALVILREGIAESVPTKLFDAFSVACPVVLSASGEARRVLTETVGGVCSAPGDAESLADALRRLAEDRELARALGDSGKQHARRYDRDRIMSALAARIAAS
jgi:colanic acid biosynthesis glycosyl transferase WcaI